MFKEKIKELMNSRNVSQRELANELNITESAMSRYISGERKPRVDILTKLARYFDVSIEELIGVENEISDFMELRGLVARSASSLTNDEIKELLNILSSNIKWLN